MPIVLNPQHNDRMLEKQDRILTHDYSMRVRPYHDPQSGKRTFGQNDGVNLAINYREFIGDISEPIRLAAAAGANAHELGHSLKTPRISGNLGKVFEERGSLWQQAFNIAEDWRMECHIVNDSHLNGPLLLALYAVVEKHANPTDMERFILLAGRLYIADEDIMGKSHLRHLRDLRDLAVNNPLWDRCRTVGDAWSAVSESINEHVRKILDENSDLLRLNKHEWADALIEHAVMYHDKFWSMKHLGHPENKIYLRGSEMVKIIDRIMILMLPGDRANLTTSAFEPWQDITAAFRPPKEEPQGGTPGAQQPGGKGPEGQSGGGKPGNDEGQQPGGGKPGKDEGQNGGGSRRSYMDGGIDGGCRCGTCGR